MLNSKNIKHTQKPENYLEKKYLLLIVKRKNSPNSYF